MRQLIQELSQPMVDKIYEHEDNIQRISSHANDESKKLFHVENIVYEKGDSLDVFEKIYQRIADVVAERRKIEVGLIDNNSKIMHSFEMFEFKMTNHDKELKSVLEMSKLITDENRELKDIMRRQNNSFTTSLSELQAQVLHDNKELREGITSLKTYSEAMLVNHGSMSIELEDLTNRANSVHE